MNERIEVLRRLQSIDTKLKRLEGDKLYRGYDVQKKLNQIQQKKAELSKISEETKILQRNINSKELDLKSIETEINKFRQQMNQVKTNKEYSALKSEIGGKEADKSVLEDGILRMMTTYEEMQQRYKSFEKVIAQEESQLMEVQKQVETDIQAMESEISELKQKHSNYAPRVKKDALKNYNRFASQKDELMLKGILIAPGC